MASPISVERMGPVTMGLGGRDDAGADGEAPTGTVAEAVGVVEGIRNGPAAFGCCAEGVSRSALGGGLTVDDSEEAGVEGVIVG